MKSAEPEISVVIPCYNEEAYLGATLKSLKNLNTNFNVEIIVVDNNSSDKTLEIAESYGVKTIKQPIKGVCLTRQAGVEAARAPIIVSTDADTTFKPNWLTKIYNEFKNNPDLVLLGGPCRFVGGAWWTKVYTYVPFGFSYLYYLILGRPYYITATNTAYRKSAFCGYDAHHTQGGDEIEVLKKMKNIGHCKIILNNPVYTSSRRLSRGLVYNTFVTFGYYYFLAHYVNRLFKRTIIKHAPDFRDTHIKKRSFLQYASYLTLFIFISIGLYHNNLWANRMIKDNSHDILIAFRKLF